MLVRCTKHMQPFLATPKPYPSAELQITRYDKNGDQVIWCPTCGLGYFHYNQGADLAELGEEGKAGWHADRPLQIIEPEQQEA